MPGKARRVASRQAQLGRKRKRQQARPSDAQPAVLVPAEIEDDSTVTESQTAAEPPRPTPPPAPIRPSPVAARNNAATPASAGFRSPGRARRERPATYNYIGSEVRRILGMSSVVLAVIIVLGIVL